MMLVGLIGAEHPLSAALPTLITSHEEKKQKETKSFAATIPSSSYLLRDVKYSQGRYDKIEQDGNL